MTVRRDRRWSLNTAMFWCWAVSLLTVTWFPFDFTLTGLDRPAVSWADDLSANPTPAEIGLNVLLFIPAGVLLQQRWKRDTVSRVAFVVFVLAGVSAIVEIVQATLPTRDPTAVDILANSGGAAVGALIGRWGHAPIAIGLAWWRCWATPATLLAALAGVSLVLIAGAATVQRSTRLEGWDARYPLLVGNEQTADRGWSGQVFLIEITDRASDAATLQQFAAGHDAVVPAVSNALDAHFRFSGDAPYRDERGQLPDLVWAPDIAEVAPKLGALATARRGRGPGREIDGSVEVGAAAWLHTGGPVPGLTAAITRSAALTIQVSCATHDLGQRGPARLVSNSIDVNQRNFTLGQDKDALVVRLRTRHTGDNGSHPEVRFPGVFTDTGRRDLLVTYDGMTVALAVRGVGGVRKTAFSPATIVARSMVSLDIATRHHRWLDAIAAWWISLIPGVALAASAVRARDRWRIGAGWSAATSLLIGGVMAGVSGAAVDWEHMAVGLGASVLVLGICAPARMAMPPGSLGGERRLAMEAGR